MDSLRACAWLAPAGTSRSGARVVFQGDGGGKAPALARALHGRAKVARALMAGLRTARKRIHGFGLRREEVNGAPGARFLDGEGDLIAVMSLDIAEGQIQGVRSVVNPDKLRHLGPVADVRSLLRRRRRPPHLQANRRGLRFWRCVARVR